MPGRDDEQWNQRLPCWFRRNPSNAIHYPMILKAAVALLETDRRGKQLYNCMSLVIKSQQTTDISDYPALKTRAWLYFHTLARMNLRFRQRRWLLKQENKSNPYQTWKTSLPWWSNSLKNGWRAGWWAVFRKNYQCKWASYSQRQFSWLWDSTKALGSSRLVAGFET